MKTYQPFILKLADDILELIDEVEPLPKTVDCKNRLCDMLTTKFINGQISSTDTIVDGIFDEDELTLFINEVIVQHELENLKEKGLIDSYDDVDGEEIFFLTKEGINYVEKNYLKS